MVSKNRRCLQEAPQKQRMKTGANTTNAAWGLPGKGLLVPSCSTGKQISKKMPEKFSLGDGRCPLLAADKPTPPPRLTPTARSAAVPPLRPPAPPPGGLGKFCRGRFFRFFPLTPTRV
jgi:hypothetical protein